MYIFIYIYIYIHVYIYVYICILPGVGVEIWLELAIKEVSDFNTESNDGFVSIESIFLSGIVLEYVLEVLTVFLEGVIRPLDFIVDT
jgi:hypothetical protein